MEAVKAIDCKSVATLIVLRLFILVNYRLLLWYDESNRLQKCCDFNSVATFYPCEL